MNYDEMKKRFDKLMDRYNTNFYATRYPTSIAWNTLVDDLDQLCAEATRASSNANSQSHLFTQEERDALNNLSLSVTMTVCDARLIRDYTNAKRDQGCI